MDKKEGMVGGILGTFLVVAVLFFCFALWKGCSYLSYKFWIEDYVKQEIQNGTQNFDDRLNTVKARVDLLRDQQEAQNKEQKK